MEDALRWSARRNALISEAAGDLLQSEDPQAVIEDLCRSRWPTSVASFSSISSSMSIRLLRLNAFAGVSEEEARKFEQLDYGTVLRGCVSATANSKGDCTARDLRAELRESYGVTAYCCHPLVRRGG